MIPSGDGRPGRGRPGSAPPPTTVTRSLSRFVTPARGTTLAIVLWVLVAMGALTAVAGLAARMDLALSGAWSDHAAALGLAETGVAEATAARAGGLAAGERSGSGATGTWVARWEPAGAGTRIVSVGRRYAAERTVEARIVATGGGAWRVVAWREVR